MRKYHARFYEGLGRGDTPGLLSMNNKSEFTYGPTGGRVKIVETVSGSVTSTKQFIGGEERDGSGNVTKQFFSEGQRNGSNNYFYGRDHLSSARTMTDNSGASVSDRFFEPFGRTTVLAESVAPDFGFSGMYFHTRSGLNLTMFRGYSPILGRWISRDPLGEALDTNLYAYAYNDATNNVDPSGLAPTAGIIRCPCNTFRLPQSTIDQHITPRHQPQIPLFNTSPRGVFSDDAWKAINLDRIIREILCAHPNDPRVTKTRLRGNQTAYTSAYKIQEYRSGIPTTPWPIGMVYPPAGTGIPVITYDVTVVINDGTGTVVTVYPGIPGGD